ncbi:MAG: lipocalin-like domain-containing protein [Gammaproteobacteria bacterium]
MRRVLLIFSLVLAGLFVLVLVLREGGKSQPVQASASVRSLLGPGEDAGFRRAEAPGEILLPRDHGPHPDYRSEWWYFTGNLSADDGREFGFQLTFFRFALASTAPSRSSDWAADQIYMAHFALTDASRDKHRAVERLARGSAGLAGARIEPFEVWLDDWTAKSTGLEFLPLQLSARDAARGMELKLELGPGKEPVRQGEAGLSQKGAAAGNASWYYSYTRLPAAGSLQLDGEQHGVSGLAWLDREWSTSSLDAGVQGWDWFSLQLDDGRDLMIYSLRQLDGQSAPQSAGSLVARDGDSRLLSLDDFELQAVRSWLSPATGVSWPLVWQLRLPQEDLELEVRPSVRDQEQDLSVRYWEGSVDVFAPGTDQRLGRGYMELTGYQPPSANSLP